MRIQWRELKELCSSDIERINPALTPNDEFWYVDISSIDRVNKTISEPILTKGESASVRARQIIRENDVLVSTTRPNLNAVALVPEKYNEQICSTGFCVLRCGEELDSEYLFYFSRCNTFINSLSGLVQGALYPAITDKQVLSQFIPWHPIEKQRHIAIHLKTRLAEVEKARKAVEIQLQETEKLANAIIFNSINRCKPQTLPLGKVLDEIKQGIGENWADFPVLGATKDGLAPAKSPPGKKPERYKPVFPGTVFYNTMRILIGSIAFVDEDDTPGITSPDYVVLKGKPGVVDSRWFYYWLRSPLGEHCILSLARGAVRERMLFSRLSKGNIELPDFKVQQDAAAALAVLKPLRRTLERQLDEITQLPQKILAQAFEIET